MNGRKGLSQLWRERGITAKFSVAFGALLVLIGLITIASIVALTVYNGPQKPDTKTGQNKI